MVKENFIELFADSFRKNWDLPGYSDYGENDTLTYADIARQVARLHLLFEQCHIRRDDKIALIGRNSSNWAITYVATVTYGAVIVPILHDFNPNDVHHIANHSESKLLFTGDSIWESLEEEKLTQVKAVFSLRDFRCLTLLNQHEAAGEDGQETDPIDRLEQDKLQPDHIARLFAERYPNGFTRDDIRYADKPNSELASINYTSGTTGFSKGVMTTCNNLAGNVTFGFRTKLVAPGYRIVCFLPMAHAYGCAFDFLASTCAGCHIHFIGKTPSPKVLLKAFADIRPNLIITVPLILEKIYKKMILPEISRPAVRMALRVPGIRGLIYKKIRDRLTAALGGRFCEVIVGGAAMNEEVTEFLHRIGFRFTIGYGMTECAPLISYDNWRAYVPGSCGQILKDIMEVRIDSPDPLREVGEIQVRGENVMQGYYKNPEATASVFTPDGWLRTGDLGTIDTAKRIYIRGRSKSMILSSNGQNIYPEEIESKLNNLPYVSESVVVERKGRLVALVYPDYDALTGGLTENDLPALMETNRKEVNKQLAYYEQLAEISLHPMEFEKTPKRSIKRFLYH